jgi:ABC-type antimicrobial peptide transport system permease subunit
MPYQQHPAYADELQVVIQTAVEPGSVSGAVRKLIAADHPGVALRFETLESMVANSISLPRFRTVLLGVFSAVAVFLALAGVYGVMSYLVEQRRMEFGVRLALGATGSQLAGLTLRSALVTTACGILLGAALSTAAFRALEAFLFEIRVTDPVTWILAASGLALVALLAAWLPARRAAALNPSDVLRSE